MQKILTIWVFFENRLHWQFEVEKKSTAFLGYMFIYVQIKHIYTIPYMYNPPPTQNKKSLCGFDVVQLQHENVYP
jgi:hypothetical protein